MTVGNQSDRVRRKISLRTGHPVGLSKIALLGELDLLLTSPVHANKTRITMVGGAYVPTSVTIAPEEHAESITGFGHSHGDVGGIGIGLNRIAGKTISVRTIEIPHVIRGFANPITLVYLIARRTVASIDTGKNGMSARYTFHMITNRSKQTQTRDN